MVLVLRVALKHLLEGVLGLSIVGYVGQRFETIWSKPALLVCAEYGSRLWRDEVLAPCIEHLLEDRIDL